MAEEYAYLTFSEAESKAKDIKRRYGYKPNVIKFTKDKQTKFLVIKPRYLKRKDRSHGH